MKYGSRVAYVNKYALTVKSWILNLTPDFQDVGHSDVISRNKALPPGE